MVSETIDCPYYPYANSAAEAVANELIDEVNVARPGGRAAAFGIAAEEVRKHIIEERGGT